MRANRTSLSFAVLVCALHLTLWSLLALERLGLEFLVLRATIGFVVITLVPGMLLLRTLDIEALRGASEFVSVVGASLVLFMSVGVALNSTTLVGVARPLTDVSLLGALTFLNALLMFVLHRKPTRSPVGWPQWIRQLLAQIRRPAVLFFILLPLWSVLGTLIVNNGDGNYVLLVLLLVLAAVPALVAFDKIPQGLYSLALGASSLALVWHQSLVSNYLVGADIHSEFFFASQVLRDAHWDPTVASNLNAMLSVTMLSPGYAILLGVNITFVFKLICPALYALVPIGLFEVLRRQLRSKVAFLAVFFFISNGAFIAVMPFLVRQEIAEVFFVLCLLCISGAAGAGAKSRSLLIMFAIGLVVSHYGLSYLFALMLGIAIMYERIPRLLARARGALKIWRAPRKKLQPDIVFGNRVPRAQINLGFSTLFLACLLGWYLYTSTATPLSAAVRIGDQIANNLSDLFSPAARDPDVLLAIGATGPEVASIQRYAYLFLQYLTQFIVVVGIVDTLITKRAGALAPWFTSMAAASTALVVMSIALPFFAAAITAGRMYHVALFFLAPLAVLGASVSLPKVVNQTRRRVTRRRAATDNMARRYRVFAFAVLSPYLLFSSGFVFAVTGDRPTSLALSPDLDGPRFRAEEVAAADWLVSATRRESPIYADVYGQYLLSEQLYYEVHTFWGQTDSVPPGSYVFLRCTNARDGLILDSPTHRITTDIMLSPFYSRVLLNRSIVYENECAKIYF